MRCLSQNPGENTHDTAFAIVVLLPSENRIPLCKRDLDWYLDDVDDDPSAELASVTFL